ncbi:MAG: DUF2497 domain-containing protein [Pseudomonadota bacterium]
MAQDNEASVEEILESIKKVIARDNRDSALDARRRRAAGSIASGASDFDQPIEAANPSGSQDAEEVLDLAEMEYLEDQDWEAGESSDDADDDPQLTTDSVRGTISENLAALAMLAEPGVPPQIVRSGETSLEGLTRELLRPMLADWLDKNLPGIVEKLVQAEIAKIAGKRR